MNTKQKLKEIIHYYSSTRQVGHTTGMLEGANYVDNPLILVHSTEMGDHIKRRMGAKNVSFVSLNSKSFLRGLKKPLFIDNCAAWVLFKEALHEIQTLEEKIKKLEA
jgi:hypothetical protein